ncbi:PucR family transcriptional regulator [Lactobacillaceae bacterium Melli_B4]
MIENMVNLLSLENMQVSININDERQRKSEFFETLLSKSIPEEMFVDNLKFQGLNIHDSCQAFAIDEANSVDTGNHQFVMHKIMNYIYWYFEKIRVPIIVINWHFKIFVLVKTKYDIREILDGLREFLNDSFNDFKIRIGFTSYVKELLNFKQLMNESNEALQIAKRKDQIMPNEFRPKQVDDILHFIPSGEANMFIDSLLGPIFKLDSDEQSQLMDLLIQYFNENQSLSRAANNLFLHRNTAVYRLKKIEKTLDLNLREPKEVEQISLAIKLYSISNQHRQKT